MTPDSIVHLATPRQWAEAQTTGSVSPPSLAAEGFVHCSTGSQVPVTIEQHFAGVDDLVLLRLDPAGLGEALRWEEGRPGEVFPHVHRAIAIAEVLEVIPWRRAADPPPRP